METGIVEAGANGLVASQSQGREFSAQDILIPKILLCQPTSVLGDVPQGHFTKSTDTLDLGKTVTVIPLSMFKTWVNFDVSGGKPQYRGTEPCNYKNDNLPWEYEEDGVAMRRDINLNFYCLIPSEIDREIEAMNSDDPDMDDALMPVVLSFSRTSIRVGREIATHFAKIEKFRASNPNISSYPTAFTLGSELNTNDQGKWFTWKVESKAKSTVAHRGTCAEWHKVIGSQSVKVHDTEAAEKPKSVLDTLDDVPF